MNREQKIIKIKSLIKEAIYKLRKSESTGNKYLSAIEDALRKIDNSITVRFKSMDKAYSDTGVMYVDDGEFGFNFVMEIRTQGREIFNVVYSIGSSKDISSKNFNSLKDLCYWLKTDFKKYLKDYHSTKKEEIGEDEMENVESKLKEKKYKDGVQNRKIKPFEGGTNVGKIKKTIDYKEDRSKLSIGKKSMPKSKVAFKEDDGGKVKLKKKLNY